MSKLKIVAIALIATGAVACYSFKAQQTAADNIASLRKIYSGGDSTKWPAPVIDEAVRKTYKEIGSLGEVTYPADNPTSAAKRELGKMLFFDPRLSVSEIGRAHV